MGLYDINFRNIIVGLLPIAVRKGNARALGEVLGSPFAALKRKFVPYRDRRLADMSYNAQYPNLQRMLNDRYDETSRRIRVYDNTTFSPVVVYPNAEHQPVSLPVVIFPARRYSTGGGFSVEIPREYAATNMQQQIFKTVNIYKFRGTIFQIIYNG